MFTFNLVSITTKRVRGHARFCFSCGCRALLDLETAFLVELRFCRKAGCAASEYEREVIEEYMAEQRQESLIAIPDDESVAIINGTRVRD